MHRQSVPWTRTLCTASALQHLAYLGRQAPSTLTPAELPRRGRTLTVSDVGAAGAGESAMPVLAPGGGVGIDALGRRCGMSTREMEKAQVGHQLVGEPSCRVGRRAGCVVET
jgi:anti-sigma factor RsiW